MGRVGRPYVPPGPLTSHDGMGRAGRNPGVRREWWRGGPVIPFPGGLSIRSTRFAVALFLAILSTAAVATAASARAPEGAPGPTVDVPDRSTDPVVLTGAQLPSISAGPEILVRHPEV